VKKYTPEQIVTLLRQIEVEIANGKDHPTSLPGRRDHGADVLPLEERVWRAEAGQGQETQGTGTEERQAQASGGGVVSGKAILKNVAEGPSKP
jgi:hypothetical protein